MKKVSKIEPTMPVAPVRKKISAYARVSMETDRMMHSLSSQVSYYSELIQKNPEWQYVGVYADNFISGTSTDKRTEFQRLIADCEAGKIDIVLTKSISRFAKNTVELLETVRHLKELRELTADVLGLEDFDEDIFLAQIDHIDVRDGKILTFHFKDGHTEVREWKYRRAGHKCSEEQKEHMRKVMKEKWTPERREAMGEKVKQIRSETFWNSKGKSKQSPQP